MSMVLSLFIVSFAPGAGRTVRAPLLRVTILLRGAEGPGHCRCPWADVVAWEARRMSGPRGTSVFVRQEHGRACPETTVAYRFGDDPELVSGRRTVGGNEP